MTVTELIAVLQTYPPDAVVCIESYDREYGVIDHDPAREVKAGSEYYDVNSGGTVQAPTVVIA